MTKVFVSGYFNVLHPGHNRLFKFAKQLGDKLVIGVLSDKQSQASAYVNEDLRVENLKQSSWIDEVILIDQPLDYFLAEFKPEVVLKGKEHEHQFNLELEVVTGYGGKLVFSSGDVQFSSLELIRKDLDLEEPSIFQLEPQFLLKHGSLHDNLQSILLSFADLNVCVIGDLIVDEYITCDPLGMSQEDPTIVVTPIDRSIFLGGAGIVAAHAASLGAKASFLSVTGTDETYKFAHNKLKEYNVDAVLVQDSGRPTTLKQRFRAASKTLLRVSHLHQGSISEELQKQIFDQFIERAPEMDVLVFSDFNYGCLPQSLVEKLIEAAKQYDIILAADSQCSSQIGDVARFTDMDLLTPTEKEARISLRNNDDGLASIANELKQKARAKNVCLKIGAEGMLMLWEDKNTSAEPIFDRLKAFNSSAVDVAGAGDSLLITAAMGLATKAHPSEVMYLANAAAAIQVGRVGNIPLNVSELTSLISKSADQNRN